jgi:NADPH:quinone reductase-like Zn-dependent oxidoreductase
VPPHRLADRLPDAVHPRRRQARLDHPRPGRRRRRRDRAGRARARDRDRTWVTSRDEAKREKAIQLGADAAFEPGARLPERVDAVLETVGAATWSHSLKALKPGGTLVVSGATSGQDPPADLNRVFFLQLSVIGSTMGTRDELDRLARLCAERGIRPPIDATYPLEHAREALTRLNAGDVFGKLVLTG